MFPNRQYRSPPYKGELCPVRHAGKADAVLFAIQTLFGEQDVEERVARLRLCVVNGDRFLNVLHVLARDGAALGEKGVDLVADVVALDVDHVDGVLGHLVLLFPLPHGVLQLFHLAFELVFVDGLFDEQQDDAAAQHGKDIARLPQDKIGEHVIRIFARTAERCKKHVLRRTQDDGDTEHDDGNGEQTEIQPAFAQTARELADQENLLSAQ